MTEMCRHISEAVQPNGRWPSWAGGFLFLIVAGLVGLRRLLSCLQQGDVEGHIQSLVASFVLILMAIQFIAYGLLADAVASN